MDVRSKRSQGVKVGKGKPGQNNVLGRRSFRRIRTVAICIALIRQTVSLDTLFLYNYSE